MIEILKHIVRLLKIFLPPKMVAMEAQPGLQAVPPSD
jgi:hypothetical protein